MDEDEDDSINSSPTPVRAHSSKRSRHWRNRDTTIQRNVVATGTQQHKQQNNDEMSWFELFEADRLDCQRALEEPQRIPAIPASQNFMSLQSLLESQQLPQEEAEEVYEEVGSTSTDEAARDSSSIVQAILQDFCSSPSYDKDEKPNYYVSPQFRFYNKTVRTYSRSCPKIVTPLNAINQDEDDEDEERMSCSSDLSVQEDFVTQMPITSHCDFDANSSQRICENLLNLSAFFSQNNLNSSIDLPAKGAQSESLEEENLQDASDILRDNGYLIGNTEECKFVEDCNESKAAVAVTKELSLFRVAAETTPNKTEATQDAHLFEDCLSWFAEDLNTQKVFSNVEKADKIEAKDCEQLQNPEYLADIPFSEWQPMDMPNTTSEAPQKTPKSTENPEVASNDCNHLEEIPWSQWQPIDMPDSLEFRTASNRTVQLTEEMQRRAAMLMADLENNEESKQLEQSTVFHTASQKTIKVTPEMQRAAKDLLADLADSKEAQMLEEIPFSEWQPMEISQETKANDCSSQLDVIPLSEWQPMDLVDTVEFRTASNKTIEVSEEQQREAAKLMAAVESSYSLEPGRVEGSNNVAMEVQFRTAANKPLKLTEEMRKRAAMLMADLETVGETTKDGKCSQETVDFESAASKPVKVSEQQQKETLKSMENVETDYLKALGGVSDATVAIQFRTASNKTLKLTEEMQKRAAMLMADLGAVQETTIETKSIQETIGFSSATSKSIKVSEEQQKEDRNLIINEKTSFSQTLREDNDSYAASVEVEFKTASNKTLELTEEMRQRAAMLMADLDTVPEFTNDGKSTQETVAELTTTNKPIQSNPIQIENTAKPKECDFLTTATPKPTNSTPLSNSVFETPKCTPELQDSLTQLSERSPLDKDTKSSIITRRNLLSLNKRRKSKRDAENQKQFTPMASSTSTPVPNRKENITEDTDSHSQKRSRRCSQETPRVQETRVGKRRSEEALSPIYAPTNKTRRLGLSRLRNKSSNEI